MKAHAWPPIVYRLGQVATVAWWLFLIPFVCLELAVRWLFSKPIFLMSEAEKKEHAKASWHDS